MPPYFFDRILRLAGQISTVPRFMLRWPAIGRLQPCLFMKNSLLSILFSCALWATCLAQPLTFTTPIKQSGPDPWVLQKDGWYYYMNTTGRNLTLWRTKNLAALDSAEHKV